MHILDAGAGTGIMQWYLAEWGVEVLSVDRESRAYLPLRFRLRYQVRGKRQEDLQSISKTLSNQASERGLVKSLASNVREVVRAKPAQSNKGSVIVYNQNLLDLADIPDGSQDVVVAVSSLEHNSPRDLHAVVKELTRIIKPGGTILATLGAARDKDWFHEPSKGWCYTSETLQRIFDLSPDVPTNYALHDELLSALRSCRELEEDLASFYSLSGENGMPWGIWDPQYQPVGVRKVKRDS